VIVSFRHAGLEALYRTDSVKGIQPDHAAKLRRILGVLNVAATPADVNMPGYRLHPLKGDQAGRWSVRVNGNWRVTFGFIGADVELLDYEDYH
jgi:proteic killer suppression protein